MRATRHLVTLQLKVKMEGEISAEELRKRLKDYGISTGPITPTTFPVYVRKLNSLRSHNSGINQKSRRESGGRSTAGRVSAASNRASNRNGFSSDEDEKESESDRLSMSVNHGVASYSGVTRRNNFWDVNRSYNTSDASQQSGVGRSSTYEQLSLARPSLRSYGYQDSVGSSSKYAIPKSGVGMSPVNAEGWSHRTLFAGGESGGAVAAGKAASSGFGESRHSWQLISKFIVCLVLFFVAVVVVSYCFVTRSSQFSIDSHSDYMLCSSDVTGDTSSSLKCTSQSEVGVIQKMIRELLDALSLRAGDYDCGYQSDTRSMRRSEIIQLLNDRVLVASDKKASNYLPLIASLCSKNDHWGVLVYHGDSEDREFALESVVGRKSLWCRIADSARHVFSMLVLIVLAVGAACGLFVCIRLRRNAADAERLEVLELVEKIVDMLQQNAAAAADDDSASERCPPPYLVIPHVRDALIPLHLRRAKQRVWDRAVNFLSAHESRVRVEHRQISGEDFAVWHWIQPAVDGAKVWQGQAFGENTTALRSRHRSSVPQVPLTPCLKIRNMFDATVETGVEWQQTVKDAVLEKCSPATIVHITVDSTSTEGCVYVRCIDLESAGTAFKALHGWWFDGRLVTVKYLREQRYEERYPESRGATVAVRPSNNSRLSLSWPFHSSIIENS